MSYVGVLIKRKDGKMLFQLRDNKPHIHNPNKWGLFGGGIKKEETPQGAAIRELKEELCLEVNEKDFELLLKIPVIKKYIYRLKLDKMPVLKLKEGADMQFFSNREILEKKNLVISLRIFLIIYHFISRK